MIPLAILIAGRFASASMGSLELLGPSVLALAVWSSAFTSVAISTAFERRYGVLERLATTPLGKSGLLAGKALAVIMIIFGQLVILSGAALGLGWRGLYAVGGSLVVERATPDVKRLLDPDPGLWGSPPPGIELMRRMKSALDPAGLLSPGRLLPA